MPEAKDQPRPSRSPHQPPSRQQPPPPKPISQGAADLFEGFDSGPTAGKDESWDAFGGSSASNGGAQWFQADFGGVNGSAPPATAPPAAAPPAIQDNFASFPPQQQPTTT